MEQEGRTFPGYGERVDTGQLPIAFSYMHSRGTFDSSLCGLGVFDEACASPGVRVVALVPIDTVEVSVWRRPASTLCTYNVLRPAILG